RSPPCLSARLVYVESAAPPRRGCLRGESVTSTAAPPPGDSEGISPVAPASRPAAQFWKNSSESPGTVTAPEVTHSSLTQHRVEKCRMPNTPNGRCNMNNGNKKTVKTGKAKATKPQAQKRSRAKAAKSTGSAARFKLSALDAAAKVLAETGSA